MNNFLLKYYDKPNIEEYSPRNYNFTLYVYLRSDYLASIYLFKYIRLFTLTYGDFSRFYASFSNSFKFKFLGDKDFDYFCNVYLKRGIKLCQ